MSSKDKEKEELEVPEYEVNLDELHERAKQTKHHWVDRGAKLSCEGANHPHHSHFKVKR